MAVTNKITKTLFCAALIAATSATYCLDSRDHKDLARYFDKAKVIDPGIAALEIRFLNSSEIHSLDARGKLTNEENRSLLIKCFSWSEIAYKLFINNDGISFEDKIDLMKTREKLEKKIKEIDAFNEVDNLTIELCAKIPECKNIK